MAHISLTHSLSKEWKLKTVQSRIFQGKETTSLCVTVKLNLLCYQLRFYFSSKREKASVNGYQIAEYLVWPLLDNNALFLMFKLLQCINLYQSTTNWRALHFRPPPIKSTSGNPTLFVSQLKEIAGIPTIFVEALYSFLALRWHCPSWGSTRPPSLPSRARWGTSSVANTSKWYASFLQPISFCLKATTNHLHVISKSNIQFLL